MNKRKMIKRMQYNRAILSLLTDEEVDCLEKNREWVEMYDDSTATGPAGWLYKGACNIDSSRRVYRISPDYKPKPKEFFIYAKEGDLLYIVHKEDSNLIDVARTICIKNWHSIRVIGKAMNKSKHPKPVSININKDDLIYAAQDGQFRDSEYGKEQDRNR